MKKQLLVTCLLILSILTELCAQNNLKLWYTRPATRWVEALPVGNGRIGAMIFGGVQEDLIQLNETTLWSGGPAIANANPGAAKNLPLIRKALLEENNLSRAD